MGTVPQMNLTMEMLTHTREIIKIRKRRGNRPKNNPKKMQDLIYEETLQT